MKLPHFLFRVINLVMLAILRSPLHGLFSGSVLALRYTGRRSGRQYTVPARYLRDGDKLMVITSADTGWWPNFQEPTRAEVLMGASWQEAMVVAQPSNPNVAGPLMRKLWAAHPSDAAYMGVKLTNGEPDPADFARAMETAVAVCIEPSDKRR